MPAIPPFMLKKLYLKGSLANTAGGFSLSLKNTLAPGTIIGVSPLVVDGKAYPPEQITITSGEKSIPAQEISAQQPYAFPIGSTATLTATAEPLAAGAHNLVIAVLTREVGELRVEASDTL